MADRNQMMTALRNADAAGDAEAARRIAAMIQKESAAKPAADRGALEKAGEFAKGVGGSFQKALKNTGLEGPRFKLPDGSVRGAEQIDVPDTGYGTAGKIAGELAVTAYPGALAAKGAMALPGAARLLGKGFAPTLGRSALQGAAGGAAGSTAMGDNPLEGAAWGAVGGPLITGAGKLLQKGGEFGARAGRLLADTVDDRLGREARATFGDPAALRHLGHAISPSTTQNRVAEVVQTLRRGTQVGPQKLGQHPTIGDFASERLPELKALQEFSKNNPGNYRLLEALRANKEKLEMPLEQMVAPSVSGQAVQGGRVPLSAAEQLRFSSTRKPYRKADREIVVLPEEIENLVTSAVKSPLVGPSARDASQVFRQGNMNRELTNEPTLLGLVRSQPAQPARLDPLGMVIEPAVPAQPARASIKQLDSIKKEIDKRLKTLAGTTNSADKDELYQLQKSRSELVDFMRGVSKQYAKATSRYAKLSEPQEQGEAAKVLLDALRKPGDAGQKVGTFLDAIEQAPRTLKRAGQAGNVEQLSQVMTPNQMNSINQITDRLRQRARYDELDAPQTILPKYITDAGVITENIPTSISSRPVNYILKQIRKMGRVSDEEVRRRIAEFATEPQLLADLLERQAVPGRLDTIVQTLRQRGAPIARNAPGGTMGAIMGMTANQE
jgi:hypothetical protein